MRGGRGIAAALLAGTMLAAGAASSQPPLYRDVSAGNLPLPLTVGLSMDAQAADLDGDGDMDIVVAMEWAQHLLLINDGTGRFTDEAALRSPRATHDHEEAVVADLNGDRTLDLLIVSEDDQGKELYLGDGKGRFTDATARIPVKGVTNGARAADIDRDGDPDLIFANAGPDAILINDGKGNFTDESGSRLPRTEDVSQDVQAGDLDGDGDLDLVFGNEDGNRLLLNDGRGAFSPAPDGAFPPAREETRKVALGDVDGDGDLDIHLANVKFRQEVPDAQDRLLINDGKGRFTDETTSRLPKDAENAAHGDLHDLDGDGDLDILSGHLVPGAGPPPPIRALLNDGKGVFAQAPEAVWPATFAGRMMDSVQADFDGDGAADLYIANRLGADLLLLRNR